MTTLVFLASLGALIIFILLLEDDGGSTLRFERKAGLLTWLTSGNWPAKIGGILMIVGVGALLRYALLNIEIAAEFKLASGILFAFAFGMGSMFVPEGPTKRALSLALGGAAFGVAYLTAYSAFALFGYFSYPKGIALLAITAAATGVYAITRSSLSLAMLAMVGAYLAPAFSVDDPGPLVVYGYYAAASLMTLVMVKARGWRPLIHLSFLFTLAGGIFFAWTSQYYTPIYAREMLPMIVLLAAIHVAMPIVEKSPPGSVWLERLDVVYTLLLPTTAALLGFVLAQTRVELSIVFMALGVIWGFASLGLALLSRTGVAVHAVIGLALFVLGIIVRFQNLPWELVLLGFTVAALAVIARRYPTPTRLHNVLAAFVVLFGALHILSSNASPLVPVDVFINGIFLERIIAAVLLIVAGSICRRIRQSLDTLLLAIGILWLFISIGFELIRWNLANVALVAHWFTILVAASLWIPGRRIRFADNHITLLLTLILVTAWWASVGAAASIVLINLVAGSLAVFGIAVRPHDEVEDSYSGRSGAALVAPMVAFIWASQYSLANSVSQSYFGFTIAVVVALFVMIAGRYSAEDRRHWLDAVSDVFLMTFAVLVLKGTLLMIVRDAWAVSLEIACFAGIVWTTLLRRWASRPLGFAFAACMLSLALILQANLLRLLGPEGNLDVTDLLDLRWPTAISLLWAVMGSALTIWSRKVGSRTLWTSGSVLLVAAALKLLLVDFGSLGQLANILAVIAAGGVFLLVGWLAPMPPAAASKEDEAIEEFESEKIVRHRRGAWSVAVVLLVIFASSESTDVLAHFLGQVKEHTPSVSKDSAAADRIMERERRIAEIEERTRRAEHLQETGIPAPRVSFENNTAPLSQPTAEASAPPQTTAMAATENRAATPSVPEPTPYTPPPAVDEHGVPTYTQFSLPKTQRASAPNSVAAGNAGIQQLLNEGRIRKAMRSDMLMWLAATNTNEHSVPDLVKMENTRSPYLYRTYVVTGDITFPAGLFGAHAVTFIVPNNVARPAGNPGHSSVLTIP